MISLDQKAVKPEFTPSQAKAVDNIISFIAEDFNKLRNVQALSGPGGTGKTFVTNYIIEHSKYSSSMFYLAAPTHKACRILSNATGGRKVTTIQAAFGFRLDTNIEDFDPNLPAFKPIGPPKVANVKVLVVDEASMLNKALVTYINKYCNDRQIKVLYIGDASQLAPVNEKVSTAFKNAYKTSELKEIVRQEKDNPVTELLAMLRDDIKYRTFNFLSYIYKNRENINGDVGYKVYTRQEFTNVVINKFSDENFATNVDLYRMVAYTNNAVSYWNKVIRQTIVRNADKTIINRNDLIMSYTTIVDDFNDIIINNSEEYIIKDIVNYEDETYNFKGFMIKFQAIHGGAVTKPLFVINHFDAYTLKTYCDEVNYLINKAKNADTSTRSSCWKKYYEFKRKYLLLENVVDYTGKIIISRDIDYGFALTSHRSQGSTYDNVFVDINDMCYDKNGIPYNDIDDLLRRLYVACSRCRNKLYICYG